MFLDETGITTHLLRRYGRAPRGARVHDHAPCGRWQTSTFLAALRVTGLTAPGVFDGAIDGESFRAYIEQILVPTLQPGDIVIADNLGAHKVAGIQRAIQAAGATLWYLPPYSPDLNPIELCFAKLTALVRTARCRSTETRWPFLGECLAHFSPDECRNSFRHWQVLGRRTVMKSALVASSAAWFAGNHVPDWSHHTGGQPRRAGRLIGLEHGGPHHRDDRGRARRGARARLQAGGVGEAWVHRSRDPWAAGG